MVHTPRDDRHVKGINLVGLVKLLRVYRRQKPIRGLSPGAMALLDDRILVSSWYPLQHHWELLGFMYREMLGSDPEHALAMGLAGGKETWKGTHRVFVSERGAISALNSMGPAWRSYFDFGELDVDVEDEHTVRFTVRDYADCPVAHGMTIAGWHLAAAQLAGSPKATIEVLDKPWAGAREQVHVVRF
jgi:hypothetical protein